MERRQQNNDDKIQKYMVEDVRVPYKNMNGSNFTLQNVSMKLSQLWYSLSQRL